MMKHYVQCDEQAVTEEVFAELTPRLVPKKQEKKKIWKIIGWAIVGQTLVVVATQK